MTAKATTPKTTTRTRKAAQPATETTPTTEETTVENTEQTTPEAPQVEDQTPETPAVEDPTTSQVEDSNEDTDDEFVWEEPPVVKKQTKREKTIEKLKTRPDTFARVASGLKYRNMASEWRKEEGLVVECTADPATGLFSIYAKWNPEEAAKIAQEKADAKAKRDAAKK